MPKNSCWPRRVYEASVEAVWMALINEKIHGPLTSLNERTGPWVATARGRWAALAGAPVNWLKEERGEASGLCLLLYSYTGVWVWQVKCNMTEGGKGAWFLIYRKQGSWFINGNSNHFRSQICWLHPKQEERTLSSKAVEKEKVIWQCFYLIYLFIQQGFIKCSYQVSGNKHVSFCHGCTNKRGSVKESANKTKQPNHFPSETSGS